MNVEISSSIIFFLGDQHNEELGSLTTRAVKSESKNAIDTDLFSTASISSRSQSDYAKVSMNRAYGRDSAAASIYKPSIFIPITFIFTYLYLV